MFVASQIVHGVIFLRNTNALLRANCEFTLAVALVLLNVWSMGRAPVRKRWEVHPFNPFKTLGMR